MRWLREFVDVYLPAEDIGHRLTMAGIEVSNVHRVGSDWARVVIGHVDEIERHPNADNLFVAKVDVGEGQITLVTAAPNLKGGEVVPVIRPGGRLDADRVIEGRRFRGIMSEGMLCSGAELGISADDRHICVLEPDAPIGVDLYTYLGDDILDIELTPNRSDCFGVVGIAREVSAITGAPIHMPWEAKSQQGSTGALRVFVDDPDLAPRYTAILLEDIRVGPSPSWLQRRLHLCGVRPISNVVDVTNYVMLETGQPLHAFDADRVQETTIRVRRARPGERLTTIDGVDRELSGDMLVIADTERPVGLAGVMGGLNSEITDATTRVVLESANFDAISIRRTSRALKLQTEASKRFDKGLDVELPPQASDHAVALLAELAGARAASDLIDVRVAPPAQRHVTFGSGDIAGLIGHRYADSEIDGILGRLGFDLRRDGERYDAGVPSWRRDVEGKADIAEEVARIVGYDVIPTVLRAGQLPSTQEDPAIRWEEVIRGALASAGLQEVITYSLVDPLAGRRMDASSSYPNVEPDEDSIPIANPQSIERSRLRRTLLPSVISTLAANLRHEPRVAIFEIARVYVPPLDPLPREPRHLAIAMAGRRSAADWNADTAELDFYDLKATLESAFHAARLPLTIAPFAGAPWLHPGRAAAITVESQTEPIGFMGQVHPRVAERFDVDDQRIYAAEIELGAVLARADDQITVRAIPRFPAVARDLAMIVETAVSHEQLAAVIRDAGGPLLESLTLFDVYQGTGIPKGYVSLAYSMSFRSADRTLDDDEVNAVMSTIEQRVGGELGARVRGR